MNVTDATKLSGLHKLVHGSARPVGSDDALIRSIQQSLSVEGHHVPDQTVRDALARSKRTT